MKPISRRKFLKAIAGAAFLIELPALAACRPTGKGSANDPNQAASTPTTTPLPQVTPIPTEEETQLPFLQRNWQRAVNPYPLPDWFLENRVQGHTRLTISNWLDKPEFKDAAGGFKGLGANAFTRHVKTGDEDPWWPSAVPVGADGQPTLQKDRQIGSITLPADRNVVKEMVANAHNAGMHMIAYCRHFEEKSMVGLHPKWVCHNLDGAASLDQRGVELDITGGYREIVLQRLLELAEMGVDGFYFDESHLPYDGCYQTALAQAFTQVTGQPVPTKEKETDPVLIQFLDFQADQVEKTFIYWRDTVKARYPAVVFVISTTYLPTLTNRRMTTNLACIADSAKNELNLATNDYNNLSVFSPGNKLAIPPDDIRNALGWVLLRDASEGRPAHIWAAGFPSVEQRVAFTAAVVTYGGVANTDVLEDDLLQAADAAGQMERDGAQQAFALGNKVSPYLAHTQPLRWAAVHFSELARNRRGGNAVQAWREVLWPVTGAFQQLLRAGVPVSLINDRQLDRGMLEGYRLLFLPNPTELLPSQKNVVSQFKAAGGVVIENQAAWQWSSPQGSGKAGVAFQVAIKDMLADAPLQLTGADNKRHAAAYHNPATGQLVVALTQDFSWLQIKLRNKTFTDAIHPPPAALQGITLNVKAAALPKRVTEVISGQDLAVEKTDAGFRVNLAPLQSMALVVVEP